jgi:excisionase family DNA binding protein
MSNPFDAIEKRLASIEDHIAQLNERFSNFHPPEEVDEIEIGEAAKMLGLARQTVYTKTSKKLIPHYKSGKRLIFSRRELRDFIRNGEVKTLGKQYREMEQLLAEEIKHRRT